MPEDPAGAATGQGSGPPGLAEPWPELTTGGARPPERAELEAALAQLPEHGC